MTDVPDPARPVREPVLSPVDRVSEMLFGLFMALTFTGAVSVAEQGDAQIRTMFIAALGCNLAWGLVDAVMYLVRTVTDRGRVLSLIHAVRAAPDAQAGRGLIERFAVERCGRPGLQHGRLRRFAGASWHCPTCLLAPRSTGVMRWPRWRSS